MGVFGCGEWGFFGEANGCIYSYFGGVQGFWLWVFFEVVICEVEGNEKESRMWREFKYDSSDSL